MANVTVLGLGAMGSRMAANVLAGGHQLSVWNRSPAAADGLVKAGAQLFPTPRAAVAQAEVVIAMVRDDEASRAVWLDPATGAMAAMKPGAVGLECSTISFGWARTLAAHFAEARRPFLDAPVVGSRPQAQAGQLIFVAGGEAAVLEQVRPILNAMGSAVHHAGAPGDGTMLKLAINALFGIQVAAMGEILGVLSRAGMDVAKAVDIIGATPACSPAAKGAAMSMLSGAFPPMFPVELVAKDFGYASAAAEAANAQMPLLHATANVFSAAIDKGLGAENLTGIVRLYR